MIKTFWKNILNIDTSIEYPQKKRVMWLEHTVPTIDYKTNVNQILAIENRQLF